MLVVAYLDQVLVWIEEVHSLSLGLVGRLRRDLGAHVADRMERLPYPAGSEDRRRSA